MPGNHRISFELQLHSLRDRPQSKSRSRKKLYLQKAFIVWVLLNINPYFLIFKETVAQDFYLWIFHQSSPSGPLIHVLTYFWIQFWIRRDTRIQYLTCCCSYSDKSSLSAKYYSDQSKLAAEYLASKSNCATFNIAVSQNSPLNMLQLIKLHCKNI